MTRRVIKPWKVKDSNGTLQNLGPPDVIEQGPSSGYEITIIWERTMMEDPVPKRHVAIVSMADYLDHTEP